MMKNKKKMEIVNRKLLLIGIILISIISFIFLVSALTDDERVNLESELNNLISDLNSQGYSWLIDALSLQLNNNVYNNQKLLYSNLELT